MGCLTIALWLTGFAAGPMPQPPPVPPPAVATMSASEVEAMARDIALKIAPLRGLAFQREVPVRIVDDAEARRHFQELTERYWPREQMAMEQSALTQLGLLPEGYDIREGLFTVLEEQAAGYYDLEKDVFCVLNDMPRLSAPIIIAHELTHALDDQHFDIDAMLRAHIEASDRSTALAAIVEGSGIAIMTGYMVQEMATGQLPKEALLEIQESEAGRGEQLKAAPQILQSSLLAPYLLGQTFLMRGDLGRLLNGVAAADIDRAFRNPPLSTEQLLHPEKYWEPGAEDAPRAVALPDLSAALGEGWKLLGDGDLGEMTLAIMTGVPPVDMTAVESMLPASWTNDAAAGWDGDLWQLYGRDDRRVTVLASMWDSAADAVQFADAIRRPGRTVAAAGDAVVLATGDASASLEAAAARALESLGNPQKAN
jgi:hypothetical protein